MPGPLPLIIIKRAASIEYEAEQDKPAGLNHVGIVYKGQKISESEGSPTGALDIALPRASQG